MRRFGWQDVALLIARVLIGILFIAGAAQKLASPDNVTALLELRNLPATLIWPALSFNAAAGLMLILGVHVRLVSIALAIYCGLTSVFHFIPADPWQMSIFVKNWSIAGGCLALGVAGSGCFAVRPDPAPGEHVDRSLFN